MISKFQHSVQLFTKLYGNIPSFVDVFDEETFYMFAGIVIIATVLLAVVLSRYITLKEAE